MKTTWTITLALPALLMPYLTLTAQSDPQRSLGVPEQKEQCVEPFGFKLGLTRAQVIALVGVGAWPWMSAF